ncbi:hypothetical protein AB0K20_23150 [Micromonospora matsumotoense]|uniref:hypothetical protein n=1 Tax=Micromonospora matsumotoense TaxID=121616 RepID=UPI00342845AB
MSTDTDTTATQDAAGIRLNVERFLLLFRLIGCVTLTQIAAETGLTLRQVRRARNGGVPGEVFMARTVAALQRNADRLAEYGHPPTTLDDLFVVTTEPAAD